MPTSLYVDSAHTIPYTGNIYANSHSRNPNVHEFWVDEHTFNINHPTAQVTGYALDIRSATDYYAFGAPMPGRMFNNGDYRYGFNGKENDRETVSTGEGTQDYGMRIYNPSLGKFLSVDPLTSSYPFYGPYQFAGNRPIQANDVDGAEPNFTPLKKYEYGEEVDLKTVAANRVMAIPNTATNLANSVGSLFANIVYNVSEFLRSPEDYFEEVGDYWSHADEDIKHIKTRVKEIAVDPYNELTEPLKGAQGFENLLTVGVQVGTTAKVPEYSPEVNVITKPAAYTVEQAAQDNAILKTMTPWKYEGINTIVVAGDKFKYFVGENGPFAETEPISPKLNQPAYSQTSWKVMNCGDLKQ